MIAYPTEFCYGLGCDPRDKAAVQRIVQIKRRQLDQGVILIAANTEQINQYADLLSAPMQEAILASWPGPQTWLLPTREDTPDWISGKHSSIAMRVTAHPECQSLCNGFGGAIVSTSANRHGQAPLKSASAVIEEMGTEVDFVLDAPLGGAERPSTIRDSITGEQLR